MLSEDQQWIKDTLSHKDTGRVPYHFDFTPPAKKILEKYYGSTDLNNIIGLPIRWGGPNTIKPLYADTETYGDRLKDEFGVSDGYQGIDMVAGIELIAYLESGDVEIDGGNKNAMNGLFLPGEEQIGRIGKIIGKRRKKKVKKRVPVET